MSRDFHLDYKFLTHLLTVFCPSHIIDSFRIYPLPQEIIFLLLAHWKHRSLTHKDARDCTEARSQLVLWGDFADELYFGQDPFMDQVQVRCLFISSASSQMLCEKENLAYLAKLTISEAVDQVASQFREK